MKSAARVMLAALALTLGACQGSFGSGGTSAPGGINPPVQQPQLGGSPSPVPSPSGSPSAVKPDASGGLTYPFANGPKGLACPTDQGYSCTLRFNVTDEESPSPSALSSPHKGKPTPSPSPTPSPTPSPSPTPTLAPTPTPCPTGGSPCPSPSPTPTPTPSAPQITLHLEATPKDAPKMHDPDPNAVATVALVAVRMTVDNDVVLQGKTTADFTLPKEQIGGRGFAVQLYHEVVEKRKRTDTFFGSYSKSKLEGTTLHFELTVPELPIKKGETWMLVLYGDELPQSSPSTSASSSAAPSASADASASPSPSPT